MRGRSVRLSLSQRSAIDLLWLAATVPSVTDLRRMNLRELAAARAQCRERPRWFTIFVKACALVAQEFPEMRRVYLPYPWPHFYEYPNSTAQVLIRREHEGELFHFGYIIGNPSAMSLAAVDRGITHAAEAPMNEIASYRRLVAFSRLPTPLRRALLWLAYHIGRHRPKFFGTFAVTTPPEGRVGGWLSSWTVRLCYGPVRDDGETEVTLTVDHRVIDGPTGARALARLEQILTGPILAELKALSGGRDASA
jgi:hypothetical protein